MLKGAIPFAFQVSGALPFGIHPRSRIRIRSSGSPLGRLPEFLKSFGYIFAFLLPNLVLAAQVFAMQAVVAQAFAAQVMTLSPESRLTVKISEQDMNRIGVEGDRIAQVFGGSPSIAIETDNSQGQIFVKPTGDSQHPLSLTLITESGLIQDLLLLPLDIPAETLILKTHKKTHSHPTTQHLLRDDIKELVKGMAEGKDMQGYEKKYLSKVIPVWPDVQLTQRTSYRGSQLHGLVLDAKNLSSSILYLQEKDFHLEKSIVAIGLNCFELQPGETTSLWIVKHAE